MKVAVAMVRSITVLGAGVLGLWQALTLARAGHRVRLFESSDAPFAAAASLYGGVMLAPEREAETAPAMLRELGQEGVALWRALYPQLQCNGSLVVASPRDQSELERFAQRTQGHIRLQADELGKREPDLAGRFGSALFFAGEAHMRAPDALQFLLDEARRAGADIMFGASVATNGDDTDTDTVIDCRGMAARDCLSDLRGVRGERVLVRSGDISLSRPVQFLHPRIPLYVVPWGDGLFMVGATVIESEERGAISVRSALELLGGAYAVHPAFAEAEIVAFGAGVRPAFADNIPRAVVRDDGRRIFVNGAYRHGFLLGPVLARMVADYLADGRTGTLLRV